MADSIPFPSASPGHVDRLSATMAQPVVRLTTNDVTDDGTSDTVHLGDPPSPLPGPVASLMRACVRPGQHLPHASSRNSQRLFPGRRPGQPVNRSASKPVRRDRRASVARQDLREPSSRPPSPGPAIVRALGCHGKATTRVVIEAGGTWSRYAPGDHMR